MPIHKQEQGFGEKEVKVYINFARQNEDCYLKNYSLAPKAGG
jgi:hypothetical protein